MKRFLAIMVALVAIVAVSAPAFAFETSYGGVFRARIISDNNFTRLSRGGSDHWNRIDQRQRIYMYFVASENLRVVTRFEIGDISWGNVGSGGRVGADERIIELKNSYVEFNIPQTPVRATIGVQGIALLSAWVTDNDYSAAVLSAKFDPVVVTAGYIGAQNNDFFHESSNIDDWYATVGYANGPFSAELIGFYQYAHDTAAGMDPVTTQSAIWAANIPQTTGNLVTTSTTTYTTTPINSPILPNIINPVGYNTTAATTTTTFAVANSFLAPGMAINNNSLFDLGLNLGYKMDWMNAYVNFVKNLGSVDIEGNTGSSLGTGADYTGWMVDAGVNAFYGPYSFKLNGFYITGPSFDETTGLLDSSDIDWFVYPGTTSVYFSEIMGGGILDANGPAHENLQWSGYGVPMNLWTISVGAAWQALPGTKLSFSYWYFGTANDVMSGFTTPTVSNPLGLEWSSSIGNEFDFYVSQDVVDGLKLDLVAAYMIANDAYSMFNDDSDPYELGARLQWSF